MNMKIQEMRDITEQYHNTFAILIRRNNFIIAITRAMLAEARNRVMTCQTELQNEMRNLIDIQWEHFPLLEEAEEIDAPTQILTTAIRYGTLLHGDTSRMLDHARLTNERAYLSIHP